MKKIILILVIVLMVTGCSKNQSSSGNENINTPITSSQTKFIELKQDGYYVMDKKDNRILLVSTEKQDFSSTGGVNEYYDAIWLSGFQGDIQIGQRVQFELNGPVLTSYPGQGEAKSITPDPVQKPEVSKLSVEEALERALNSDEVDRNKVLVITSIKYFEDSKKWQVDLKETMGDRELNIEIIDGN